MKENLKSQKIAKDGAKNNAKDAKDKKGKKKKNNKGKSKDSQRSDSKSDAKSPQNKIKDKIENKIKNKKKDGSTKKTHTKAHIEAHASDHVPKTDTTTIPRIQQSAEALTVAEDEDLSQQWWNEEPTEDDAGQGIYGERVDGISGEGEPWPERWGTGWEQGGQEGEHTRDEAQEGGDVAVEAQEDTLSSAQYSTDWEAVEDNASEEGDTLGVAYEQAESEQEGVAAGADVPSAQWGEIYGEAAAGYSGDLADEFYTEDGRGGAYQQEPHEISAIYGGAPAVSTQEDDEIVQEESTDALQGDASTTQDAHTPQGFDLGEGAQQVAAGDAGSGESEELAGEEVRVAQAIASVFSARDQESSAQPATAPDAVAGSEEIPPPYTVADTVALGQPHLTSGEKGTSAPHPTETQADDVNFQSQMPADEMAVDSGGSVKKSVLRVSSLYKSFGRKTVVKGVEFSMTTGEVLGLLGPNGAGKTTTFYMIVGFYKPTSGDVFLDEKCITRLPMYKRARSGISYLPQEPSVFRKLTVEENIWAILETRKDLTRAEKKQKLNELIDEFAIGRIRKQQAYTLSGGERRRTEIARSLAIEPKFLLLDEPFAGIDPIAVADIKSMIRLLAKRGIGILITDHNVRDTLEITDRAIIISTGTILVSGGKEDILKSDEAREIYLGKDFSM